MISPLGMVAILIIGLAVIFIPAYWLQQRTRHNELTIEASVYWTRRNRARLAAVLVLIGAAMLVIVNLPPNDQPASLPITLGLLLLLLIIAAGLWMEQRWAAFILMLMYMAWYGYSAFAFGTATLLVIVPSLLFLRALLWPLIEPQRSV
jgi:hypothetical protein